MNTIWEIKQNLEAAHKMVSDLCSGKREWIMSIPAQPDYDPDLVIGLALRDADKMVKRIEQLERAITNHFDVTAIPTSMLRPTERALIDLVKEKYQ